MPHTVMPLCRGCGQPISTDLYLDLKDFGFSGLVCEACVRDGLTYTCDLEECVVEKQSHPVYTPVDNGRCRSCVYFLGQFDENCCCNYIFIEHTRRPCDPGKDCTVYRPRGAVRLLRRERRMLKKGAVCHEENR